MAENRFALRAVAGFAGVVMAASVATATALADDKGDRGRSEEAHENAPGQQKREDAGNPDPGNGQGNPPEHAGGPAEQTPPPGQAKSQGRPAEPGAEPANPAAKPGKPAKPARRVHPTGPARPARPMPAPARPANQHAKAGKTTICHATGSATNPYVTITISDNALPAHGRHQDGRDLIPAPAGGCPAAAASAERGNGAIDRVPAAAGKDVTPGPAAGEVRGFAAASVEVTLAGEVLGELAKGGSVPAALPPLRDTLPGPQRVTRRESGAPPAAGQLPFTGLEAALVALLGALLVLLGVLIRQVSGRTGIA